MKILKKGFISLIFQLLLCSIIASGQTSYYLSSTKGNDANTGRDQNAPWRSISKLEQVLPSLKAGDRIYFERGSVWYDVSLDLTGIKGTESAPILFTAYGNGKAPSDKLE